MLIFYLSERTLLISNYPFATLLNSSYNHDAIRRGSANSKLKIFSFLFENVTHADIIHANESGFLQVRMAVHPSNLAKEGYDFVRPRNRAMKSFGQIQTERTKVLGLSSRKKKSVFLYGRKKERTRRKVDAFRLFLRDSRLGYSCESVTFVLHDKHVQEKEAKEVEEESR